jgi:hypothetical protein
MVLKITASEFDGDRFALMNALNNIVGETEHNHHAWRQLPLPLETQDPFCAASRRC